MRENSDEIFADDIHAFEGPAAPLKEPRRRRHRRVLAWLGAVLLALILLAALAVSLIYITVAATPLDNDAGRVNMVIMGIDRSGPEADSTRADTIVVASLDLAATEPKAALVSIPRDLWLPIPGFGEAKINAAFAFGENENYPGGGAALTTRTIEENFALPVHYYAVVDFAAFEKIIDALGGVDVTVEEELYDPYYPDGSGGHTVFHVLPGLRHMDGATALKYTRSRMTTSDFDRAERQQAVMLAIKQQLATPGNLADIRAVRQFIEVVAASIESDLSLREAARLALYVRQIDNGDFTQHVLSPDNGLLVADLSFGYLLVPRDYDYGLISDFFANIFTQRAVEAP